MAVVISRGMKEAICENALPDATAVIHWGSKCLPWVACLWSKMSMFQRVGNEGGRVATSTSISIFNSYDVKSL